jgi:hypothetical protein
VYKIAGVLMGRNRTIRAQVEREEAQLLLLQLAEPGKHFLGEDVSLSGLEEVREMIFIKSAELPYFAWDERAFQLVRVSLL